MAQMSYDLATLTPNNFVACGQKHKAWVLVFIVRMSGTVFNLTLQVINVLRG